MNKGLQVGATMLMLSGVSQAEEWERSFDLGATLAKGNSDSILASAGFSASKETDETAISFAATYTYGEEDSKENINELLSDASWEKKLDDDHYYAGVRYDFRKDELADIDYRLAISGLVGVHLIKDDKTTFGIEGGFGYTWEKVGGNTDNFVNIYLGQEFEYKFDDKTKVYENFRITAPVNDLDRYSVVFEAGVETALNESLSLKVYIQDQYENVPAAGRDSNDFKLVTGVSYRF